MPVVPKICPLMQRDYCQRENCAIWHHDRCGLIVDGVFIAQSIMGHTISQEILGEIPAKLDYQRTRRTVIYWTCPYCGANLDPGERCDCKTEKPPRVLQHSQAAGGKQLLQGSYTASSLSDSEEKYNGLCKNNEILDQQGRGTRKSP